MNKSNMQIIIPMSGFGERFRRAGYTLPKPLIEVDGKPIIAHVVDMFPGETDFIFVCNKEHLQNPNFNLEQILLSLCPLAKIVAIDPHKLGPIHAVLQAQEYIDQSKPTIVNYCDFTCYWDWQHFKNWLMSNACQGALPAYRNFHPHSLGTTNYAYIREQDGWLLDIQEKQPFTNNRMNEYASSGTYYFTNGALMLKAFEDTIKNNLQVNGEYYVSLAYQYLLKKHFPVAIYDLQHFMQWGTPEDLIEYQHWSNIFTQLCEPSPCLSSTAGTVLIPMAGLGQRFIDDNYKITKPLIPVSGKAMVLQAMQSLPKGINYIFVLREDMPEFDAIETTLLKELPNVHIATVATLTDGQACSALIGIESYLQKRKNISGPLIIGACDNAALYDVDKLNPLLEDKNVDVIVWGARGHINAVRQPNMFGWIDVDNQNNIKNMSVKTPLASPATDPIVLGTFIFKNPADFTRCVERMISRHAKINDEYYIDTCINDALALGLKCKLFEVEHYISWGTPNDLKTFEYWQSCFHKWQSHPYTLEHDFHVPVSSRKKLLIEYRATVPEIMEEVS